MTQMDDRIMRILCHGMTRAELGAVLGDDLARRGVLVFEVARVTLEIVSGARVRVRLGTYDARE